MDTQLVPATQGQNLPAVASSQTLPVFGSIQDFESAQRIATALAKSSLVPANYQGNLPNCLIALEYAGQCRMSVMAVMQNLNIIQGRPSWSASFLIASVNASGKFSPLRYERKDMGKSSINVVTWSGDKQNRQKHEKAITIDDYAFRAYAKDRASGELLYGPWISMGMAHKEGWTARAGNKYDSMGETMLMYRAASSFTRLYCPEISMGMHTSEEVADFVEYTELDTNGNEIPAPAAPVNAAAKVNELKKKAAPAAKAEPAAEPVVIQIEPNDPTDQDGDFSNQDNDEYDDL